MIGAVFVFVSLGSLIFCFSKYGKGTEKVRKWVRVRVRKNTKNLSAGTGTGTGNFQIWVRKKGKGTDCFKLQRERKMYGTKLAKFLVRVRGRVRITFSFVSTGTDSVPVPALRGMPKT